MPWIGELTSYPRERPRKRGLQSWEKCHGERRREGRGGRVSGLARVGIPEAVGRRVRGGQQAGPYTSLGANLQSARGTSLERLASHPAAAGSCAGQPARGAAAPSACMGVEPHGEPDPHFCKQQKLMS